MLLVTARTQLATGIRLEFLLAWGLTTFPCTRTSNPRAKRITPCELCVWACRQLQAPHCLCMHLTWLQQACVVPPSYQGARLFRDPRIALQMPAPSKMQGGADECCRRSRASTSAAPQTRPLPRTQTRPPPHPTAHHQTAPRPSRAANSAPGEPPPSQLLRCRGRPQGAEPQGLLPPPPPAPLPPALLLDALPPATLRHPAAGAAPATATSGSKNSAPRRHRQSAKRWPKFDSWAPKMPATVAGWVFCHLSHPQQCVSRACSRWRLDTGARMWQSEARCRCLLALRPAAAAAATPKHAKAAVHVTRAQGRARSAGILA
jgi:hypothetical protein